MKQLKVRFAENQEKQLVEAWLANNPSADAGVLDYPTAATLCSYSQEKLIAFLPSQRALMLEAVARNPAANELESAQALRDLVKGAELVASSNGIKEVYFMASDEQVKKIALAHGFEEVPWPILRMRLQ